MVIYRFEGDAGSRKQPRLTNLNQTLKIFAIASVAITVGCDTSFDFADAKAKRCFEHTVSYERDLQENITLLTMMRNSRCVVRPQTVRKGSFFPLLTEDQCENIQNDLDAFTKLQKKMQLLRAAFIQLGGADADKANAYIERKLNAIGSNSPSSLIDSVDRNRKKGFPDFSAELDACIIPHGLTSEETNFETSAPLP